MNQSLDMDVTVSEKISLENLKIIWKNNYFS